MFPVDYIQRRNAKDIFKKNEITPPQLASLLERDCRKALALVKNVDASHNKALLYEVADIKTWSYLGLHFAEKIRGGIALQTFRTNGAVSNKNNAVKQLENALAYWDSVVRITRPLYKDMPLVHLSQQGGSESPENFYRKFHWAMLTPDVQKDVEIAKEATVASKGGSPAD